MSKFILTVIFIAIGVLLLTVMGKADADKHTYWVAGYITSAVQAAVLGVL